ncbi:MAG: type II toxin-antitoxin system VapC family toxin [Acidobacteria bacterium]|nr:type II toxin-antitoxin system VapC family toxin [Acidobacteriota bacterium]
MSGRYLLDTNIVVAAFNHDPAVIQRVNAGVPTFMSVVTVGELLHGAYGSQRVQANVGRVNDLVAEMPVLPCEAATADWYARVKQQLRSKGRPIPDNDAWIAATALQHQLTLVTRDQHFQEVDGLAMEAW